MAKVMTFVGLFLTLCGAALLFFYGLPRKHFGNVVISGENAMKYKPDPGQRDIPDSEWQPVADSFRRRAKLLNSTGFALVAVGTALQMAALCVAA